MWGFLKRDKKDKAAGEPSSDRSPAEDVDESLQETHGDAGTRNGTAGEAGGGGVDVIERSPASDAEAVADATRTAPQPAARVDVAAPIPGAPTPEEKPGKGGWLSRLKSGLTATREKFGNQIGTLLGRHTRIDESLYEELETLLLSADVGVATTEFLLAETRKRVAREGISDPSALRGVLKQSLIAVLEPVAQPLSVASHKPFVLLVAGVNGCGKTTSIGKLAKYYQSQGNSVMLAAGDTFRAAAVEQLRTWGERNNVPVLGQQGGDPAAVAFDAIQSATAKGIDLLIVDTAGRLPTQLHLMEELKKVKRVLRRVMPDAPHEAMLVLDANTGQNAIAQVGAFDEALGLTGLTITKLDGTARGGTIAAIARQRSVPVRFIGVGERIDDLRPFNAREFVDALFD
jgi:fused signal recognition particle receptor